MIINAKLKLPEDFNKLPKKAKRASVNVIIKAFKKDLYDKFMIE